MQTLLNTVRSRRRNFIKFCYFLTVFGLIACENNEKTKENIDSKQLTTTEKSTAEERKAKTILFFGDSLTAGYGLDDTNEAYPALIQLKIDSLGLNYQVINSGVSGETSAGGKSRIQWVLNQDIDVFVLELGANDGLRGVPLSETRRNLQAIITAIHTKNPETAIILAGMELPTNMGQAYNSKFRSIFADLATANNLAIIPFILKDVGGIATLNQSDGIHPTAEGHKILANTVWEVLKPVLNPE